MLVNRFVRRYNAFTFHNPNNTNMMHLAKNTATYFIKNNLTLATAESCTGGLLAHTLTNIPGSSQFFLGGIIAYSNAIKATHLNIRPATLKTSGAVSPAVAQGMARHIRRDFRASVGIGITGIAGPGGGSQTKPVGLVYISVATKTAVVTKKFLFKGTRVAIKNQAVDAAFGIVHQMLVKS